MWACWVGTEFVRTSQVSKSRPGAPRFVARAGERQPQILPLRDAQGQDDRRIYSVNFRGMTLDCGVGFQWRGGGPGERVSQQDEGFGNEAGQEPGNTPEVVGQRMAVTGEKNSVAHYVQMEES